MLTDSEWSTFFNLLNRIVEGPPSCNVAAKERQIITAAQKQGDDSHKNLEEFGSWDFSESI